jgi:hypothetical protein
LVQAGWEVWALQAVWVCGAWLYGPTQPGAPIATDWQVAGSLKRAAPATTCVSLYTACHYLPLALKPMSGLGLRGVATGKHWQLLAGSEPWPHPACHFACQSRPTKLHLDRWPYTVQPGWGAAADAQPQLGARQHTQLHPPPRRLCGAAHFLDFGKPFLTRALR